MHTKELALQLLETHHPSAFFLVGPNGAGKSSCLRNMALELRGRKNVIAISNTVYDRFTGLHGLNRLSAAKGPNVPAQAIKRAISSLSDKEYPSFSSISSILKYCGYSDAVGLSVRRGKRWSSEIYPGDLEERGIPGSDYDDIQRAFTLARRLESETVSWIEFEFFGDSFQASFLSQYLTILRWEAELRKLKIVRSVDVLLQSIDRKTVPIRRASSGQLTLLATTVFLATEVSREAVILIDEPENSLHPKWQSEYLENILVGSGYMEPNVVIATHAPLVVLGGVRAGRRDSQVYRVFGEELEPIDTGELEREPDSIEELLWEAFETITPANHFLSRSLSSSLEQLKAGKISINEFDSIVTSFKGASFDEKQTDFLDAVQELAEKVDAGDES